MYICNICARILKIKVTLIQPQEAEAKEEEDGVNFDSPTKVEGNKFT